ncbi:MAG: YesL family protein [Lachnospiraceae bacterium]|nr:YesL family protein [Lachnospiraceae bacterium]
MFDQIPGFLNIRNSFFEFMRKMMWVFFLNLIFIVTSLPIITMGASTTAMYSVLQKLINEREFRLFKDYFSSFKRNFVKSTLIWLVCAVIILICGIDLLFFINLAVKQGGIGIVLLVASILIIIAIFMVLLPIAPVLAEFEGSISDTMTVVFFMVKRNIRKSFMAVVSTTLIIGFTLYIILYGELIFIYFPLLTFALNGFVLSYIYDSIFRKYYKEDEELEEYDGSEE